MKKNNKSLIWVEKKRTPVLKTVVMTVMQTISTAPDGREGTYVVMDAPDWVITIPVLEDSFLMVKQWRHGEQALSIEFPGGVMEKNERPDQAAERELKEETGFSPGILVHLGSMNPNPALMSNHVHIYAAFNLSHTSEQKLDDDEYVEYITIKKEEVFKNIGTKEYPHALMAAALALYQKYMAEKKSSIPPQAAGYETN